MFKVKTGTTYIFLSKTLQIWLIPEGSVFFWSGHKMIMTLPLIFLKVRVEYFIFFGENSSLLLIPEIMER